MTKYVALLRGINVGPAKRIAMAGLRDLFAELGFTDIRTYLQSGNIVFSAPDRTPDVLANQIETAIERELRLAVACLVRTSDELRSVIGGNPFRGKITDGSKMMVLFLSKAPTGKLRAVHDPSKLSPDEIRLRERVIYQWCPEGLLAAPDVSAFVMKHWKVAVTVRNWNTVQKLAELLAG